MRPFTSDEAREIAEACRRYLHAHELRADEALHMTMNEQREVENLRHALAAREREALAAAMGTAA